MYTHNVCFSKISQKISIFFSGEFFNFYSCKNLCILQGCVFILTHIYLDIDELMSARSPEVRELTLLDGDGT